MKKRLEWFIVPCVATMFAGNAINLHAQDTPKAKQRVNVVINHAHDDEAKNLRDKVAKELANSGVSEEIKARILKDVEEALTKVQKKLTVKSTKSADKEESAADAGKLIPLLEKMERINPANGLTTHFFMDPRNDSYRIGVQCIQSDAEDGDDESEPKEGLEVRAVIDESPAKKAGMEEGDVLLTVNATKINNISDLTNALQEAGKNEKEVTIEAKRDEKVISLTVKPTKMKSSDIGLENIRLSLPTEGFVVNDEVMKTVQEQMKKFGAQNATGSSQVWSIKSDSEELKKDLAELKSEMAELKKMIKDLAGKKSE